MFTGIITHKVTILSIDKGLFTVSNPFGLSLELGQSIAHDGACMTITSFDEESYSFFAMEESLNKTNFGKKSIGDVFNVELCLQIGSRLDGHFVTGHIDNTGSVKLLRYADDGSLYLGIGFDTKRDNNVIEKGSITINGVSLTVVDVKPGFLSVWLIPITQEITNLGTLSINDTANLEFDMLGKYMIKYLENTKKYSK